MTFWQILRATTADSHVRTPLRKQLKRSAKEESGGRSRRALSGSNIVQRPFKDSQTRRRTSNSGVEPEVAQLVGMLALQEPALRREEVVTSDMTGDVTTLFGSMAIGGVRTSVEGELEKVAKIQKSSLRGYGKAKKVGNV